MGTKAYSMNAVILHLFVNPMLTHWSCETHFWNKKKGITEGAYLTPGTTYLHLSHNIIGVCQMNIGDLESNLSF